MKRFSLLIVMLLTSACQISIRPRTVQVDDIPDTPALSLLKGLVGELQQISNRQEQQEYVKAWMADHPEEYFPVVTRDRVYFLYADLNEKKGPVDRVSLAYAENNQESGKTFLHPVHNTPLYFLSLGVKDAHKQTYSYFIHRGEKSIKAEDVFNPFVKIAGKPLSILVDHEEYDSLLMKLALPRPDKTFKKRKAWVYLPPGYFRDKNTKYPVLYMQDGQNLWTGPNLPYGGWKVDKILDKLIREKKMEPIIVVGLEHSSERTLEYVGFSAFHLMKQETFFKKHPDASISLKEARQKSHQFSGYFINYLIPWTEQQLRAKSGKAYRAVAGASFGAGISLHLAFKYPGTFFAVASLSGGNFPHDNRHFLNAPMDVFPYMIDKELPGSASLKIYLHCGDRDMDKTFLPYTQAMRQALLKKGWQEGKNLIYVEDKGKGHNEKTWSARMEEMLIFMFDK